ncbi:MAG: diacylglycerol kinase [Atopobiaceae bacterium]|nr:diacylglycerol kinase [Atopobiaceae bacterium]
MRVLIIHNLASGFGSDAIYEFQRALVREGDECVMRLLTKDAPDRGASLLVDAEEFDLVVISGGDGTVATLLYLLRNRNVLTCVFPSGTANLLFANIGNAAEPSALARACRIGHSARTDLGEVSWRDDRGIMHKEGFCIMVGLGFDAQIMKAAIPAKRSMGQAAYFAAALANPRPEVQKFTITVDGEVHERTGISCLVANNAKIQGDIDIIPDCSMNDGVLDVFVVEAEATAQLISPLFVGFLDHDGKLVSRPHISSFKGREVLVESSGPLEIEVDGDPLDGMVTTYYASIIPGCSKLVVDSLSPYAHEEHKTAKPLFGDAEQMPFPL